MDTVACCPKICRLQLGVAQITNSCCSGSSVIAPIMPIRSKLSRNIATAIGDVCLSQVSPDVSSLYVREQVVPVRQLPGFLCTAAFQLLCRITFWDSGFCLRRNRPCTCQRRHCKRRLQVRAPRGLEPASAFIVGECHASLSAQSGPAHEHEHNIYYDYTCIPAQTPAYMHIHIYH